MLPGPAPKENDKFPSNKTYYEIPIAIQDRAFNADGSLFYPDTRSSSTASSASTSPRLTREEFSPIWNPEFFGNTIIVNGNTWPFQTVEKRRYRFRFLNGCQSRFLILDFNKIPGVEVWAIGNEGGYLAAPVNLTADNNNRLLMALAERSDLIVDFTNVPTGNYVLGNVGPDEPFGGGVPGSISTFLTRARQGRSWSSGSCLPLPPILHTATVPADSADSPASARDGHETPCTHRDDGEGIDSNGDPVEGPVEALLGTVGPDAIDTMTPPGVWTERKWMEPITEDPAVGATEVWEFYNTTGDAHPMHIHEIVFEVVNREGLVLDGDDEVVEPIQLDGAITPAEPWETGFKDTVVAYPGQVTRVRAQFANPGQFVWHCHIVEHEDNEMMRPFRVGPVQPGQPRPMP